MAIWAGGARVVKAFNTTGFSNMANPRYPESTATMFICGDDEGAKEVAAGLIRDVGFDPEDAGPLRMARYMEPFTLLMAQLAYEGTGGPELAYRFERLGTR